MAPPPLALDGSENSFVGRAELVAKLTRAIVIGRSLVVIGPPGVGKTRLIAECLRELTALSPLGVALGDTREIAGMISSLGASLGLAFAAGTADAALARLRRTLVGVSQPIVLDGFELLPPEADALLADWLETTQATFIVTSRRRVAAPLEHIELAPLRADAPNDTTWSEAAELLRARTQEVARVRLGPEDRGAAHALVSALGGLPQSIELAAARLGVLSAGQLLERVTSRSSEAPGALGSNSLDPAIASSFALLGEDAQACLMACASFPGGTDLSGLEAVAPANIDVISALMAARNHSLLEVVRRDFSIRYQLSRSVRYWLRGHAREQGLWSDIERRHASYWASRAPDLAGDGATLRSEAENLQAAFEAALGTDQHTAASLALLLADPCLGLPYATALELIRRVRLEELPTGLHARLMLKSGTLCRFLGECIAAEQDLILARDLAQRAGESQVQAEALAGLGATASAQSQWERSRRLFAEARAAGDDGFGHALTLAMVGNTYVNQDAWDVAEPLFRESIQLGASRGDAFGEAFARLSLGVLLVERGAFDEGFGELVDAIGMLESGRSIRFMNTRHLSAVALSHIGRVRQETGDTSGALVDFHRARRIADEEGARRTEAFALCGLIGLLLELGEFRAAEDEIRVCLPLIRETGRDYEGVLVALRGVHFAMQGLQADAERLFAHAASLLERDRRRVFGAVLSVLLGREEPLDPQLESFADVRLARRLRARFFVKLPEKPLLVARDASFFRLSDHDHAVALGKRRAVRGVLRALVEAHSAHPGVPLSVDDLIRAGWPGERILPSAAAGRVYTAIATLRRMGLRGVVEQNGTGYLIPAGIPLLVHEDT